MNILTNVVISAVISVVGAWGVYHYAPLSLLEGNQSQTPKFGSTITTINGNDTLSSSRTVINNNFANLNTDKLEANATTLNSLTSATSLATLAALSTVGTITSGTWNATAVTVPYGGTGSTTLSSNQVLLGNGTGNIKTVVGWGTSGQSLQSNGAGAAPTWVSGTVDTTQNYNWTGANVFATTTSGQLNVGKIVATSTVSFASTGFNVGGASLTWPSSNTTGFFKNDGSGNLSWTTTGLTSVTASTSATFAAPTTANSTASKTVYCVSPKLVSGGGISGVPSGTSPAGSSVMAVYSVTASYPDSSSSWTVTIQCTTNGTGSCNGGNATAYAMCVNP